MKTIVLAGGCFWGVEAYFSHVKGVIATEVGYANGNTEHPTYEEVCTSKTGHAEVCHIQYDDTIISLKQLLDKYWKIINPVLKDQQGPDKGSQYRTGIYYLDISDVDIIKKSADGEKKNYDQPIVTEIEPLANYYKAEVYHQKYLKKNPNGYCHIPKQLIQNP